MNGTFVLVFFFLSFFCDEKSARARFSGMMKNAFLVFTEFSRNSLSKCTKQTLSMRIWILITMSCQVVTNKLKSWIQLRGEKTIWNKSECCMQNRFFIIVLILWPDSTRDYLSVCVHVCVCADAVSLLHYSNACVYIYIQRPCAYSNKTHTCKQTSNFFLVI